MWWGAFTRLPSQPSPNGRSPSKMGEWHGRCNSCRVSSEIKRPLIPHQRQKCRSHHCNHEALTRACTQLLLPPAVDGPASSHTDTLRNASSKASAGFCKCVFHKSCRSASRFTVFCTLAWTWYSSCCPRHRFQGVSGGGGGLRQGVQRRGGPAEEMTKSEHLKNKQCAEIKKIKKTRGKRNKITKIKKKKRKNDENEKFEKKKRKKK